MYGVWSKCEYRWVEFSDIECREVWKPSSLQYWTQQIRQQLPLKPVHLGLQDSSDPEQPNQPSETYCIIDGIHRINALKSLKYTHVLAYCNVPSHQKPVLPPIAAPHYEKLRTMAFLRRAAGELIGVHYLSNDYNFYIISQRDNTIEFSILAGDTNISNVETLPPDCEVVVTNTTLLPPDLDGPRQLQIDVTATIFERQFEYSGTLKDVSTLILQEVYK